MFNQSTSVPAPSPWWLRSHWQESPSCPQLSLSPPFLGSAVSPPFRPQLSLSPSPLSVQLDLLAVPPTGHAHSQPSGPRTGCSLCLEHTSPDTTWPTLTSLQCLSAQGSLLRKAAPPVLPHSLPLGLILLYLCLFLSTLRHVTYI